MYVRTRWTWSILEQQWVGTCLCGCFRERTGETGLFVGGMMADEQAYVEYVLSRRGRWGSALSKRACEIAGVGEKCPTSRTPDFHFQVDASEVVLRVDSMSAGIPAGERFSVDKLDEVWCVYNLCSSQCLYFSTKIERETARGRGFAWHGYGRIAGSMKEREFAKRGWGGAFLGGWYDLQGA